MTTNDAGSTRAVPDGGTDRCPDCESAATLELGEGDLPATLDAATGTDPDADPLADGPLRGCTDCATVWRPGSDEQYAGALTTTRGGRLGPVTAGAPPTNFETTVRLLAYTDAGVVVRDCGDGVDWGATGGPGGLAAVERQLGPVYHVAAGGYPLGTAETLSRTRLGYRVAVALGPIPDAEGVDPSNPRAGALADPTAHPGSPTHQFDANAGVEVVEATAVGYALDADVELPTADRLWERAQTGRNDRNPFPSDVGTLTDDDGAPIAKLHVYPLDVRDESGTPLIRGIQLGDTPQLELFTADPADQLAGPLVDTVFVAPSDRPYFAVFCVAGTPAGATLSHDLRVDSGLPLVHRGTDTSRTELFDVRFHRRYLDRWRKYGHDRLYVVGEDDGYVDVETGTVEDTDALSASIDPPDVVVTRTDVDGDPEVARLRRPDGATDDATDGG